jgi:hypothetical protein
MWNTELGEKIAAILNLISRRPNSRPHPQKPGVELFDGGEMKVMTGIASYRFSDGSTALWGTGPDMEVAITLSTGQEVHISVIDPARGDTAP